MELHSRFMRAGWLLLAGHLVALSLEALTSAHARPGLASAAPLSLADIDAAINATVADEVAKNSLVGSEPWDMSRLPHACGDGAYFVGAVTVKMAESILKPGCQGYFLCEPGTYCVNETRIACPPGTYSDAIGALACKTCDPGYICTVGPHPITNFPLGSTSATQKPCVPPGTGAGFYCPAGSGAPHAVATGHYTTPTDVPTWRRTGQALCETGHYCVNGERRQCPAGTFGNTTGLSDPACSGLCESQYLCPPGSTQPREYRKPGGPVDFCHNPELDPRPFIEVDPLKRKKIALPLPEQYAEAMLCPRGCWCLFDGTRYACPAGRAGLRVAEIRENCSDPCAPGFYCPRASTSVHMYRCGSQDLYCPEGSAVPIPVTRGYYTTGGELDSRSGQSICPPGYYCSGGVAHPCPEGRYTDMYGDWDPECSGLCARGYFCLAGAPTKFQNRCGHAGVYCPPASSHPLSVDTGFYSVRLEFSFDMPGDLSPSSGALLAVCGADTKDLSYRIPVLTGRGAPAFDVLSVVTMPAGVDVRIPLVQNVSEGNLTKHADTGVIQGGLAANLLCSYAAQIMLLEGTPALELMQVYFVAARWSLDADATATQDAQLPCPEGYYCQGGLKSPCPGPTYGSTKRLNDPACSGLCEGGYYCPDASTSARQNECGAPWLFCPPASIAPTPVSQGWYTLREGADDYVDVSRLPLERRVYLNVTKRSGSSTTRTQQKPCPAGTFCIDGDAYLCPSGRYGAITASVSPVCDGPCAPGYFCEAGSIGPFHHKCGNASYYCPEGSGAASWVAPGYYTSGGRTRLNGGLMDPDKPVTCDDTYAEDGLAYPAAARPEFTVSECHGPDALAVAEVVVYTDDGVAVSAARGIGTDDQTGVSGRNLVVDVAGAGRPPSLTVDQHGIAGTVTPVSACQVPRSKLLGPSAPTFDRKRRCYGGPLGDEDTRSTQVLCEPGHFCWYGLRFECPPGSFGNTTGLSLAACSGLCAPGYWCEWGSTNATQHECGGPDFYCPIGSGAPTPVDIGYYTDPEEPPNRRSRQILCEPGWYCTGGIRYPCPAGRYGSQYGLSSPQCTAECAPGYYCPTNSSSATAFPCGHERGASVYCPPASAHPIPVSPGMYTIGGYEKIINYPQNTTRVSQLACTEGTYCAAGIKYQCPAGSYGGIRALASPTCSGPCSPGYFCPPGSVSPRQFRCGDYYVAVVDALAILAAPINVSGDALAGNLSIPNPAGPMLSDPAYDFHPIFEAYEYLNDGGAVLGGAKGSQTTNAYRDLRELVKIATGALSPLPLSAAPDCGAVTAGEMRAAVSRVELRASGELVLHMTNVTAAPGLRCPTTNLASHVATATPLTGNWSLSAAGIAVDIHIPWESGARLKPPALVVPITSFATKHRLMLQGGPAAVYCPAGSGYPTPVPLGWYSYTSRHADVSAAGLARVAAAGGGLNGTALPPGTLTEAVLDVPPGSPSLGPPLGDAITPRDSALANVTALAPLRPGGWGWQALVDPRNTTRDAVARVEPGYYAVAGIRYPCAPGFYGNASGLFARTCSGWCPAAHSCPLAAAAPLPCPDGTYAPAGAAVCSRCPGAAGASSLDGEINRRVTDRDRPVMPGAVDGQSTMPSSPPAVRCKHARYCCGL